MRFETAPKLLRSIVRHDPWGISGCYDAAGRALGRLCRVARQRSLIAPFRMLASAPLCAKGISLVRSLAAASAEDASSITATMN
jgi:hypothetical protein